LQNQIDQFEDIISRNPEMKRIFATLPLIADSNTTVLITGESGTGKELVARALHNQSARRKRPLVAFNCAAVPETLIESELFGYRKGAFTDAVRDKPGRIAQADGGTLFLDEVGDLSLSMQVKLLRFLQDHRYEPLGGTGTVSADVRIIAATHVDLRQAVTDGRFREDLFYRIHIIEIPLPPLSRRTEDIPLLVRHFVRRLAGASHRPIEGVSGEALALLMRYPWPGNIRELENAIEHAVVLCRSTRIGPEHLPPHLFATPVRPNAGPAASPHATGDLGQLEREAILKALDRAGGNRTRAARKLPVPRTCRRQAVRGF
jgi:transcriptional regulator with PAS, ATPase and Fis domain